MAAWNIKQRRPASVYFSLSDRLARALLLRLMAGLALGHAVLAAAAVGCYVLRGLGPAQVAPEALGRLAALLTRPFYRFHRA